MRIAILDDEQAELDRITHTLQSIAKQNEDPWSLHGFNRGEELLKQLKRETFDLLILDWQLPDVSGLAVLRWSRKHLEKQPPVIMLTSRNREQDVVLALNEGADDYINKPFRSQELQARVLAVLRRQGNIAQIKSPSLKVYDLLFDDTEQQVKRNDTPVNLTEREYSLAKCLISNIDRPLSREYLYERFWPREEVHSSRPLDTHIYRLRTKLGLTPENGWRLATIYGYGYRLERIASE
ncbi:response regulator transcription factor [Pseudomonas sp. M30-35]|uniref:response regulator transcription factor n=1 Tax=Pseudomonas sp. M30-35 TaxID=1981174 RepID=UPI000B3C7268|nr:response regulator transcription factor [Pseudomonas sp. M30-35]ARU87168.1 DNA-binding response regulator [Pseudomonas sp. M30-35]